MIVPSKAVTYEESLLSKLPYILETIGETPVSPYVLYQKLSSTNKNPITELSHFLFAIDALFLLGKVVYRNGELQVC